MEPGGLLFLGTSESIDDGTPLYRAIDKKYRIYVQQPTNRVGLACPYLAARYRGGFD